MANDAAPYLNEIHTALPRLLSSYDRNPLSSTVGLGDRLHWGWKLIDFPNATFQGATHGLARLVRGGLLPQGMAAEAVVDRIDEMVKAIPQIVRRNGSLEEAFPYESSFCVTALVAFDVLVALECLEDHLTDKTKASWLDAITPLIGFLRQGDERHGIISNHLTTAAAALYRWAHRTGGSGEDRARALLDRILEHQSEEGWFREYQGADPGYQSLCTHYLADLHHLRPDLELGRAIEKSLEFLRWFIHPDGSFGGLYGCRNTRIAYPGGLEALSTSFPVAAAMSRRLRQSIARQQVVTLAAVDPGNLIPTFNSYCMAAELVSTRLSSPSGEDDPLPCEDTGPGRQHWPEAGVLVDRGRAHYTVISTSKGGVCVHFRPSQTTKIDSGVAAKDRRGKIYTNQALSHDNVVHIEDDTIQIEAPLTEIKDRLPRPADFIILRLANITIMRNTALADLIKKLLVQMLITGMKKSDVLVRRRIQLGADLVIYDELIEASPGKLTRIDLPRPFTAIHMASQGYWQVQDDRSHDTET